MKIVNIPVIIGLVCVSAFVGTIVAYAQSQTGTLELVSGRTMKEPVAFSLPTYFIPQIVAENVYAVLDPSIAPENRLEVFDGYDTLGFTVTATMSDLTTPEGNIISYENTSLVTLSESGTGVDSAAYNNPPAGGDHVTVPAKCDAWSPGITLTICDIIMDTPATRLKTNFYELTPASSTLSADANIGDTILNVVDGSLFSTPLLPRVRIGNDIIKFTGINGNRLTGVNGIDTPHFALDTVTQHSFESGPLTIMENTIVPETGLYTIGFGLRLTVDPAVKQGNYSGTMLYTFI